MTGEALGSWGDEVLVGSWWGAVSIWCGRPSGGIRRGRLCFDQGKLVKLPFSGARTTRSQITSPSSMQAHVAGRSRCRGEVGKGAV